MTTGQKLVKGWTKTGRRTCHRGVHSANIRQKRHLGKIGRKIGRLLHLLPKCLGTPWRTHERMHVEVPEGDRSSTSTSLFLRRQCGVRKHAFRRRENVVEKVILQVPSGQRLGFLVFNCECLSTGECRAWGRLE
jgi:hypothetical protein